MGAYAATAVQASYIVAAALLFATGWVLDKASHLSKRKLKTEPPAALPGGTKLNEVTVE